MSSHVAGHDELIAAAVAGSGGLVKHRGEGDSTFSVFESTRAAMVAAVAAQQADRRPRLRRPHGDPCRCRRGAGRRLLRAEHQSGRASDRSPGARSSSRAARCRSKRRHHLPTSARRSRSGHVAGRPRTEQLYRVRYRPSVGGLRASYRAARSPGQRAQLFVGRADLLTRMQRHVAARTGRRAVWSCSREKRASGRPHFLEVPARYIVARPCSTDELAVPYQPFIEAMGTAAPVTRATGSHGRRCRRTQIPSSSTKRARPSIASRHNGRSSSCSTI